MKNLSLATAFLLYSALCVGQSATVGAGGDNSGTGGTVSYSLGQVYCHTASGSGVEVLYGVVLPYEIWVTSGIEEESVELLNLFPNPTAGKLTLRVSQGFTRNDFYQLFDASGKLLEESAIKEPNTVLSLDQFTGSLYFLKVRRGNKEIKTFKIIKIK